MLADDDEIKVARDRFLACVFLAGVDRERFRDTIDELNNDYMRHDKEYPQDVQSMLTWLLKRRGNGGKSKKEDDSADGVTSFAQIRQIDRIKCRSCGVRGHFGWECPNLTPQEQAKYRSKKSKNNDSNVGSNGSSRSDGSGSSLASLGSGSSGSASQEVRRRGRRTPSPIGNRRGVFEQSHFAFTGERPTSCS